MGERFSHHIADKLEHLSQKTLIQATDANDEWDQKTAKHLAHCPECLTKFIGYPDNQGSETTLVMAKQFAQDNSGGGSAVNFEQLGLSLELSNKSR